METAKNYQSRVSSGFIEKYCSGEGIDVGGGPDALPGAKVFDGDTPGYDGLNLPYHDNTLDFVYSSHCLEHVFYHYDAIREWYRVLKVGGHLIIIVPHRDLYEKRKTLPSRWNADHKRFYKAETLLRDVGLCLPVNGYRIRSYRENDEGYDYSIGPDTHSVGAYEIEAVFEKIHIPDWKVR